MNCREVFSPVFYICRARLFKMKKLLVTLKLSPHGLFSENRVAYQCSNERETMTEMFMSWKIMIVKKFDDVWLLVVL